MEAHLKELWEYAEKIAAEELKDEVPDTFAPVNAQQLKRPLKKLIKPLKEK